MPKKAKATFAKSDAKTGFPVVVSADDIYADDHPFVKAWPDEFVDLMDAVTVHAAEPPVEQATAAPGEKRGTAKPRKDT